MKNSDKFISGLTIDKPALFFPWSVTEGEISALLNGYEYQKITEHYYTMAVTVFDNLYHGRLGLHFNAEGKLSVLELFKPDRDYSDDKTVFDMFNFTCKTYDIYRRIWSCKLLKLCTDFIIKICCENMYFIKIIRGSIRKQ